jgi:GcrA cell cycle regulator
MIKEELSGWTEPRVEQLKKLWEAGLSASQIAAELGSVTRNAVIGKVHRLGLSGRAKSPSSSVPRPRKTLLELTEDTCHWPVGDPGSPDFFFCGGESNEGSPYCNYHSRVAYQPASERRRERQNRPPFNRG